MEIKYNGGITVDPNIATIIDDLRTNNPTARVEVFHPILFGKPNPKRQAITIVDKQLELFGALFEGRYGLKLCDLESKRSGANTSVTLIYELAPETEADRQAARREKLIESWASEDAPAADRLTEMDQATAIIREKADDISHNLEFLVEVSCDELTRLGVLDAYKQLRNKDFKPGEKDHVTIGQAVHLGLVKLS